MRPLAVHLKLRCSSRVLRSTRSANKAARILKQLCVALCVRGYLSAFPDCPMVVVLGTSCGLTEPRCDVSGPPCACGTMCSPRGLQVLQGVRTVGYLGAHRIRR